MPLLDDLAARGALALRLWAEAFDAAARALSPANRAPIVTLKRTRNGQLAADRDLAVLSGKAAFARLGAELGARTALSLPLAAAGSWRSARQLALAEASPIALDKAGAADVPGRLRVEDGRIVLEVAVAAKADLAAAAALFDEAGIRLLGVDLADAAAPSARPHFDLSRSPSLGARPSARLAFCAAALALLGGGAWAAGEALAARAAAVPPPPPPPVVAAAQRLAEIRRATPSAIAAFAAATEATPNTAYLGRMEFEHRRLLLAGRGVDPSEVVLSLNAHGALGGARFSGPVRPAGDLSAFEIEAEIDAPAALAGASPP
jgi:hypothetical protein